MSSPCDVCGAQPSKYKCPNCTVKYCSLACFKSHKPTHDANSSSTSAAAEPQTETATSAAPTLAPAPAPAAPNQTAAAAAADPLTTLLSSPALQHLLQTNPSLRATLRSIYASTVEPAPEDWADQQRRAQQRHSTNYRGRGGGRGGRGGRGGGRGGGAAAVAAELNGQKARGPWKQELADKHAVERIVRAQAGESSESLDAGEGMREFVELVMAAVAAAENEGGD